MRHFRVLCSDDGRGEVATPHNSPQGHSEPTLIGKGGGGGGENCQNFVLQLKYTVVKFHFFQSKISPLILPLFIFARNLFVYIYIYIYIYFFLGGGVTPHIHPSGYAPSTGRSLFIG